MTLTEQRNDNQFYSWVEPEKPDSTDFNKVDSAIRKLWEQSCNLARENAVLVADQENIFSIVRYLHTDGNLLWSPEKNKPYELIGYSLSIIEQWWCINRWENIDTTTNEFFKSDKDVSRIKLGILTKEI